MKYLAVLLCLCCAGMLTSPAGGQSVEEVGLDLVVEGLTAPVSMAQPPDDSGRLVIVDQVGHLRVVDENGEILAEPFLDLTDRIVDLRAGFDERGVLGLAFHPDYATNGRFYVYYSAPLRDGAPDGWDHTSHISEFTVSDDPDRAQADSERIILQVDQPQFNHDAGSIAFGPDGYLYIALGDGGGANDTASGHVADWYADNEGGNGQDITSNLLGSILRIDVDGDAPYGIPSDNPFVGTEGMDEIWAYGFRNPYRFSFDLEGDNDLLVGDAGQNRWEEVSLVERGGNYGWNVKEGTHCFDAADSSQDAATCPETVGAGHPDEGAPLIDPVIEYANANQSGGGIGLVVVGGYVYRGSTLPALQGRYIFGDWSTSFGSPQGVLLAATPQQEGLWPLDRVPLVRSSEGELGHYLLGLGQDLAGEVYVLTTDMGGPAGSTGRVYRLSPAGEVAAESAGNLPASLTLHSNYPNPFNPETRIQFSLQRAADVRLEVFDAMGRRVDVLLERSLPAGTHAATWDGRFADGGVAPSGVYWYRAATETQSVTRSMTLVR